MLDIRLPIGVMFTAIGALLVLYGLTTSAEMYRLSLGHNLNLLWGGAMLAFGLLMLAATWLWKDTESEG